MFYPSNQISSQRAYMLPNGGRSRCPGGVPGGLAVVPGGLAGVPGGLAGLPGSWWG